MAENDTETEIPDELPDDLDTETFEAMQEFLQYLNGGDWAMDPRVESELNNILSEEGIVGMYGREGGDEERIPLIQKFSPEGEEWGGKTIFEKGQPRNVTLAANLAKAFPVLKPTEQFIEDFIKDYEMRLTSVDGISRDQLMRIFMAMFGSSPGSDEDAPNALQIALSAGPEDND